MQRKFLFSLIIFIFLISASFLVYSPSLSDLRGKVASVFFTQSITKTELLNKFNNSLGRGSTTNQRIKILIVPGHDDKNFGTSFDGLREADLNVALGKELSGFLNKDGNFQVVLVRDEDGFNKNFSKYLKENNKIIDNFIKTKKITMNNFLRSGELQSVSGIIHNSVSNNIAMTLYGINKWANEIKADIVLHIHFNDYPRRNLNSSGKYSGFAIYIPEKQFSNARASREVAEKIFQQLNQFTHSSNLKKESRGLVEDQDLIAIGAYNTLDPVGLLIEYGYIYEPQFLNKNIRQATIRELAYQTYLGINNFFINRDIVPLKQNSTILPHIWNNNLRSGLKNDFNVLALQTALKTLNLYPPKGFSANDCPISGNFGVCTRRAVANFQRAYGIVPSSGFVGPLTISKLNRLFSGSIF